MEKLQINLGGRFQLGQVKVLHIGKAILHVCKMAVLKVVHSSWSVLSFPASSQGPVHPYLGQHLVLFGLYKFLTGFQGIALG